ncbi:MAG: sulfate ABC transporter ATP-binding protein [Pontiellaceae bacterium]|nr:sulfate ABC transporter ATP-binding protein [Pontiellaceae bacterium]
MNIEVRNIEKRYGSFTALGDVSHVFESGKLSALLGPSGSGKTTLLRIIAGLENADQGQVLFGCEDASHRHARYRGVGFVFQHYALFRHMTVFENIAFGLRVKARSQRPSRSEIRKKVERLLKLVQLDWLGGRMPSELPGGQRQRVALARALAVEPRLLLLDEPFGALDANVRSELRQWLRRLHDEIHVTSIFVTHDVEEALEVSDQVVVMNAGKIEQSGSPDEVYDHPASPFVYRFLGHANIFQVAGGSSLYVRPHDFDVFGEHFPGAIAAQVLGCRSVGAIGRIDLQPNNGGDPLQVETDKNSMRSMQVVEGKTLYIRPRASKQYTAAAEI